LKFEKATEKLYSFNLTNEEDADVLPKLRNPELRQHKVLPVVRRQLEFHPASADRSIA
jgi:hypothetical protein